MKPGSRVIISFHSKDPQSLLDFCSRLGYQLIQKNSRIMYVTDGIMLFEILPGIETRTRLTYLTNTIEEKKEMAVNFELNVVDLQTKEFGFTDPNGVHISVRTDEGESKIKVTSTPISICGTFNEVSIETNDVDHSVRWYENIGFKVTAKQNTYSTVDDGNIVISLYKRGTCPHRFKNPSFTYFESDMKERIAELKKRGVVFVQEEREIGMEGHAIAESPDGQYFFLFKA